MYSIQTEKHVYLFILINCITAKKGIHQFINCLTIKYINEVWDPCLRFYYTVLPSKIVKDALPCSAEATVCKQFCIVGTNEAFTWALGFQNSQKTGNRRHLSQVDLFSNWAKRCTGCISIYSTNRLVSVVAERCNQNCMKLFKWRLRMQSIL